MVTDKKTGEPIKGAKVGIGWVMRAFVLTDEQGQYEFSGFSGKGSDDIHVTAEGYGRAGKDVPSEGDLDFELSRATAGDSVGGRLLGESGESVVGAQVQIVASQRRGRQQAIDAGGTTSSNDG